MPAPVFGVSRLREQTLARSPHWELALGAKAKILAQTTIELKVARMYRTAPTIMLESPLGADLGLLMQRHTADMHADTPPESIHMMDAGQLARPGIWFYVMRLDGVPVGMGAFKRIDDSHAEIKSMHVLSEQRGKGMSRQMLQHLMDEARSCGFARLSLETGVQPTFVAARALYAKAGFEQCPPFQGYWDDPNSYFMTRKL